MKKLPDNHISLLTKSLLYLKGLKVQEVAQQTGIPKENLWAFLSGVEMAISTENAVRLFDYLGVKEGTLIPKRVHVMSLDLGSIRVDRQRMEPLKMVLSMYKEHKAVMLPYTAVRTTPILIIAGAARIMLMLSHPILFGRPTLNSLGLTADNYHADSLPAEYRKMVQQRQLSISDFDSIYSASFDDWNMVRIVANAHGVSARDIAGWIMSKATHGVKEDIPVEEVGEIMDAYVGALSFSNQDASMFSWRDGQGSLARTLKISMHQQAA